MAINGGFQVGPFQLDYQQILPVPAIPGQFPVPNYVGLDWYIASYQIFIEGLVQGNPPYIVPIGNFTIVAPGTVVGQVPAVGTFVNKGTNIQLTVAMENLLSVTFNLLN
jgi:beta-lactam-binding protein with PASTA domain